MIKYRKIYEQYYGSIPKDSDGRTYEIHHIDGNHNNDSPENLKAVSIQEHYNIHYSQGDWIACHRIASKMKLSPVEISELSRKSNLERVADGTHPFLTRPDGTNLQTDRVKDGTHNFLDGEFQRKIQQNRVGCRTHPFLTRPDGSSLSSDRVIDGSHNFLTNHPCKTIVKCPYCPKEGPGPQMKQWHFDNCKFKEKTE